jgi:DNA-binding response OmpR family regulator
MPQGLCLVIEGDLDTRYLLALTLKRMGYDVQAVSSGIQGVAAAWEYRPVLVTVAMDLPDMAGCDVARHILRHSDASVLLIGDGKGPASGPPDPAPAKLHTCRSLSTRQGS